MKYKKRSLITALLNWGDNKSACIVDLLTGITSGRQRPYSARLMWVHVSFECYATLLADFEMCVVVVCMLGAFCVNGGWFINV